MACSYLYYQPSIRQLLSFDIVTARPRASCIVTEALVLHRDGTAALVLCRDSMVVLVLPCSL
jgi:hypothetical protein